jgi:uncharacterized protein (TIGR03435 family)
VDKSGLKMKVNESDQDFKIPITPGADNVAVGKRVPMQYLCWWLGGQLQSDQRPVINKTGLDKNYDFTLSFAPELPPNFPKENLPPGLLDRPSLFDALKKQLGLKLEGAGGILRHRPRRESFSQLTGSTQRSQFSRAKPGTRANSL